jgi:hypothetical protein
MQLLIAAMHEEELPLDRCEPLCAFVPAIEVPLSLAMLRNRLSKTTLKVSNSPAGTFQKMGV